MSNKNLRFYTSNVADRIMPLSKTDNDTAFLPTETLRILI